MRPRSTTPPSGATPAPPPLVLVHLRRILDTVVGTLLAGVVILIGSPAGILDNWSPPAAIVLAGVLVPLWLVAIVRAVRARVEVSPAGLRVRRVFSTRTVRAADYDGVTWNPTLFPRARPSPSGASPALRSAPPEPWTWASTP